MAVFNPGSADGDLRCGNATYLTARSGGGTFAADAGGTGLLFMGQELGGGTYYCYEGFLAFDTSSIGSTSTITAATLEFYFASVSTGSSAAAVPRVRVKDWGAGVTSADWVAGASVSGQTLVAHAAALSGITTGVYTTLTDDALAANISKTGTTYFMLSTDRFEAGTAPGVGGEYASIHSSTGASPPKLTVTWTTPGGKKMGPMGFFAS